MSARLNQLSKRGCPWIPPVTGPATVGLDTPFPPAGTAWAAPSPPTRTSALKPAVNRRRVRGIRTTCSTPTCPVPPKGSHGTSLLKPPPRRAEVHGREVGDRGEGAEHGGCAL